jgi:hypothetical protein
MTDNGNGSGMIMPVTPFYGGGNGGNGFGDMGSSGWWIILLLLCLGGWGNGYGFGGGMGGGMFPWMMAGQGNTNNDVQRGFDQASVINGITGVQNAVTSGFGDVQNALCSGFGNIQTALCGGFAGVNSNIANGFAQAEIANNARQIADMQQSFGIQSAITDCCCKQSANTADLKYTIATEAGNTRAAATANTQAILDKLCALELDGVKAQLAQAQRENIGLQNQLNMAALRESQTAQNAFIQQGFSDEVDALYNRLSNCPVPSTPVYGRTPIFTCGNGVCGCGMAA